VTWARSRAEETPLCPHHVAPLLDEAEAEPDGWTTDPQRIDALLRTSDFTIGADAEAVTAVPLGTLLDQVRAMKPGKAWQPSLLERAS
jgi:hypothetical protein